jgi:hypothetical protein
MSAAPLRASSPTPPSRDQLDIGWSDVYNAAAEGAVATAKLHVLQLEPIKQKLGGRWERLSEPVHKLFEQALKRAQAPGDSFIAAGELSYIVTFHGLSPQEAGLACAAVANEVCQMLFGDGLHDISVRSLVGTVPLSAARDLANWDVSAHLERHGRETVVRSGPRPEPPAPPAVVSFSVQPREFTDQDMALLPMWDLQAGRSSSLFLAPRTALVNKGAATVRRFLGGANEGEIIGAEIALLKSAGELAQRIQDSGQVCAMGAGVSYLTLSSFNARIRYIGALKKVPTGAPFLLKIENIPEGAPLSRICELFAMLGAPHLRLLAEFDGPIPDLELKLGAHGIGASLPDNCTPAAADAILQNLARRAAPQKKFAFVSGLANLVLIEATGRHRVRFGIGSALGGGLPLADLKELPAFPLTAKAS